MGYLLSTDYTLKALSANGRRLVAHVSQVRGVLAFIGVDMSSLLKCWMLREDNRWAVGRAHVEMEANQVSNVSLDRNGGGGRCSWKGCGALPSRCPRHPVNTGGEEALSFEVQLLHRVGVPGPLFPSLVTSPYFWLALCISSQRWAKWTRGPRRW